MRGEGEQQGHVTVGGGAGHPSDGSSNGPLWLKLAKPVRPANPTQEARAQPAHLSTLLLSLMRGMDSSLKAGL